MNTETKELTITPEGAEIKTLPVANNPLEILAAAMKRGVNTEQLSKLMDLQERYEKNEARKAYYLALAASTVDIPTVTKDKINLQYDSPYSSRENIVNTISPHLSKFGLSHRWDLDQSAGIAVTCILSHEAGHSESTTMKGPPDSSGSKNELQQIKSTITYLEIVTFEAITGTASQNGSMNDDGNNGVPVLTDKEKAVRAARPKPPRATKEQTANLKDHLESGKLNVRDTDYITANLDRMTKSDAAGILLTLKKEQST